jgi:hypothetical protein
VKLSENPFVIKYFARGKLPATEAMDKLKKQGAEIMPPGA